ncbi:hypothetical protein F4678DRAFT_422809 [Xylaria arbuscula]|nr:hypothetical protein F4678DRAFT_422809 [Xylaria arbuscula]
MRTLHRGLCVCMILTAFGPISSQRAAADYRPTCNARPTDCISLGFCFLHLPFLLFLVRRG